ncbi:MAG: class I SAM-dependent methyltransferase, partial [Phycisphaerae bacterium]
MTYYDRIAERWHGATGGDGGPFCRLVMNDLILGQIPSIEDRSILELGAGNGYFLPLLLDNFRGQGPSRVVVTDASSRLVATAESEFHIEDAEYQRLDVRARYPFEDGSFDLILAIHVFQEVSTAGLRKALAECHRVLTTDGRLIIAVTHPDYVQHLFEDRALRGTRTGQLTMPGPRSMRLPVVRRSASGYEVCL